MQILRDIQMFKGLTDQDLHTLNEVALTRNLDADTVIFEENSPGNIIYVLVEGLVEIRVNNPIKRKEPIALAKIKTNEVFGEFSIFDDAPRSATAITQTPVELIEFDRKDLFTLFDRKPRIGMIILKNVGNILCSRLRNTGMELRNSLLWIGMTDKS